MSLILVENGSIAVGFRGRIVVGFNFRASILWEYRVLSQLCLSVGI